MKIENRIKSLVKIIPKSDFDSILLDRKRISEERADLLINLIRDDATMLNLDSAAKRMLNRVENQLIEKIGLIGIEKNYSDDFGISTSLSYKRYVFILYVYDFGQRPLAIHYGKKLLREAEDDHLNDLCLLLSQFIEHYYSFVTDDLKKSEIYAEKYKRHLQIIDQKRTISKLYYDLVNRVVNNKSLISEDERKKYNNIIVDIKKYIYRNQASSIIQRVYSIIYFFYLLTGDYDNLKKAAIEALNYYEINLNHIKFQLYMMRLRKAVAHIYNGDFEDSRLDFDKLIQQNPRPGTIHWNSTFSYFFTLEMLSERYQSGANVLFKVTTESAFESLDDIWIQQWRIRSAYIHFLSKIGYVDLSESGKRRVPNFKLGKFLNEVPHYSKDKRGLNISILIAQFIILLADKKYGKLIDRTEALDKYSYRHLKNDQNLRSNCFIRMLLSLVKADFNAIRASRYAEKYVKRLSSTEMNLNEYSAEIEIIPYEELWKIILDITKPLQRKRA